MPTLTAQRTSMLNGHKAVMMNERQLEAFQAKKIQHRVNHACATHNVKPSSLLHQNDLFFHNNNGKYVPSFIFFTSRKYALFYLFDSSNFIRLYNSHFVPLVYSNCNGHFIKLQ